MNLVTINTDAGLYAEHKVGSYAYWIKSNGLFLSGSGLFKGPCENSTEAELKAIINAVCVLLKSDFVEINMLIFNRDNLSAKADKNGRPLNKLLYEKIEELKVKCNRKVPTEQFYQFRHVRAHTTSTKARNFVNNWCDNECTKHLKQWRKNGNR